MLSLNQARNFFEKKYPDHNFNWKISHKRLTALCPFHKEKHRSFNIFEFNGRIFYKCFACGEKGNVEYFLNKKTNKNYNFAKRKEIKENEKLREILHKNFIQNSHALDYIFTRLKKNIIDKEITGKAVLKFTKDIGLVNKDIILKIPKTKSKIIDFYLKICPDMKKDFLLFFYRNEIGEIVSIKFRELHTKKFFTLNLTQEKNISFFSAFDIFTSDISKFCFIVEGEFDVLVPIINMQNDSENIILENIISIGSVSNLNENLISYIRSINLIPIICLDWDSAGKEATKRFVENYSRKYPCYIASYQTYDDSKDFGDLFFDKSNDQIKKIFSKIHIENIFEIKSEIYFKNTRKKLLEIEKIYPDNFKKILFKEMIDNNDFIYFDKPLSTPKKQEFYCDNLIPQGFVSILAGASGSGKTYTAIFLALLYILQNRKPVFLWLSEDGGRIEERVLKVIDDIDYFAEEKDFLTKNIFYESAIPEPLFELKYKGYELNEKMINFFKYLLRKYNLIFLDPLLNFYGYEENDNTLARRFMNILNSMVNETEKAIVILHHLGKYKNEMLKDAEDFKKVIRGASAFVDSARCVLFLKTEFVNDEQYKKIQVIKSNVGNFNAQKIIHFNFLSNQLNELKTKNLDEKSDDNFNEDYSNFEKIIEGF